MVSIFFKDFLFSLHVSYAQLHVSFHVLIYMFTFFKYLPSHHSLSGPTREKLLEVKFEL
jgi:hypothetical protein